MPSSFYCEAGAIQHYMLCKKQCSECRYEELGPVQFRRKGAKIQFRVQDHYGYWCDWRDVPKVPRKGIVAGGGAP